jgi:non-canonical poly(A) RNA polymerase PAPD5/7
MLCLRDPADETNDLGRKGICIKHVQTTFRHLGKKLHKDLSVNTRHSLLKPLVGDTFSLNKVRRERLDAEGRAVLHTMQNSIAHTAKAIREEEAVAAQEERTEKHKLAQLSQAKSADSASESHGEAVTPILGMPSVEDFKAEDLDRSEPETVTYRQYSIGSQS